MDVTISAKHMELTDALRDYVIERVGRVKKYSDHSFTADVHLGVEKYRNRIHVTIKGNGEVFNSEAEDPSSMYKAIDLCVDKLEKQLRRGKDVNHTSKKEKERIREGMFNDQPPSAE